METEISASNNRFVSPRALRLSPLHVSREPRSMGGFFAFRGMKPVSEDHSPTR